MTPSHETLFRILLQSPGHCEIDSQEPEPNDYTHVRPHPELTYPPTSTQEGSDSGYLDTYNTHAKINPQ